MMTRVLFVALVVATLLFLGTSARRDAEQIHTFNQQMVTAGLWPAATAE